jgi:hypothetical protein
MKGFSWAKIIIFLSGVGLGLIPYCHALANETRYSNGWGGEVFLPFLPALLYFFAKQIAETFKELKPEEGDDE